MHVIPQVSCEYPDTCLRLADPPGKPGRPEVVDYDKDRADIKWAHPKSDGGSPLTNYVLEKKMKGGAWEKVCLRFCLFSFLTSLTRSLCV